MRLTVLIADDEPPARSKLRRAVAELPWLEVVGEAEDGERALELIDRLEPDIVLLDLEMPGLTGLEVVSRARHRPAVIFTTAYDRYAVSAFELQAIDYLLKPFDTERFRRAVERARESIAARTEPATADRLRHALYEGEYLNRLLVREHGRIVLTPVASIERLEARGDYVALFVGGKRYLVHVALADLERRLDPSRFVRIHRSHVVNLDHVASLAHATGGNLMAEMRDGVQLPISRTRAQVLRSLVL